LALGVAAVMMMMPNVGSAQETIVFAGPGGVAMDAKIKTGIDPTAKKLGIDFKTDTTNNGLADIRAQTAANSVRWDVVVMDSGQCEQATDEGLLAELDYTVIDKSGYPEGTAQKTYIPNVFFSHLIAWNTEKFGDNGPQSWADVWNVEKFPGTRALRNSPIEILEAALLADGVPRDQLYPLDMDRAFASLAKIKPHVAVWWSSGAQAMQLLRDGEVDVLGTWNGRIEAAIADGGKAAFTYNDGILISDCLAIPKGSQHIETAMKALAEMVSPQVQAEYTKYINYGPTNIKAFEFIDPERAAKLNSSPDNIKNQAIFDGAWWAKNGVEALERWRKFMAE